MTELITLTPAVQVIDVSKRYGGVQALKPTSFSIQPGSYYVLLGPSGGGKTTTLRLIGGLVKPSGGRVLINGADVTHLPPNRRDTSMVFQNYALFPHMSVEDNVSYGLRLRKLATDVIQDKVNAMLQMVSLENYNARMPHELSGGQQQRVQLARSLVLDSAILLLDEPLAALDAKLRKSMCLELKRIQETVGITFVHVTHNQEEAMTVADCIAVMADGELVEESAVRDIYERPQRRFTADFIGESNLFDGTVSAVDGDKVTVDLGYTKVAVPLGNHAVEVGDGVTVSVRAELVTVSAEETAPAGQSSSVPAEFIEQFYLGFVTTMLLRLPDGREALVRSPSATADAHFTAGQSVRLSWALENGRLHLA